MVSHINYGVNEGFVIFRTSKLITCFIGGFTLKMKSKSIVYLLSGNELIYWILDLENNYSQYGLYGQADFKNARAILFSKLDRVGNTFRSGSGFFLILLCGD